MNIITGCSNETRKLVDGASTEEIKQYLIEGNQIYQKAIKNSGDISKTKRDDIYQDGQEPYAVIITCADSRVPPEHIFNAGLGELFVIRTAGNVVGDFEIGSVEYAVEHLGSKLVVIMGHTHCGAVEAALGEDPHGYIKTIVDEIQTAIGETSSASEAEIMNVKNSIHKINSSEIISEEKAVVIGGIYNISDGIFKFID